jgi:hypothetical protein
VGADAYCRRLAAQHGLELDATSAGTEADEAVSPAVVELLRAEGMDVAREAIYARVERLIDELSGVTIDL